MRLLIPALIVPLALVAFACGGDRVTGPPQSSGIEGVALAGPQCPVERAGSPRPDKPVKVRIKVLAAGQSDIAADELTAADGTFRIGLLPGGYHVTAGPADSGGLFPVCTPQDATVPNHDWAQITIHCDTGIR
jgi:hypothetical protein